MVLTRASFWPLCLWPTVSMLTFPSSTASSVIRTARFLRSISFDRSILGRERRRRRLVLRSLILDSGVGVSGRELKRRSNCILNSVKQNHEDVIKWKHFPRYWHFVRGIHWIPVNSSHKGQWRGLLIFSLICAWANGWVNNRDAGVLTRHRAHYDVTGMVWDLISVGLFLDRV